MIVPSEVKYATSSDGATIAFQAAGDGPPVLYATGMPTQVSALWDLPVLSYSYYIERMTSFSTLIMFDVRGAGMSDPLPAHVMSLDEQAGDMLAVLDAAGVEQASLVAELNAGPPAIRLAAEHPERVRSLVLNMTYPRLARSDAYPHGHTQPEVDEMNEGLISGWGTGVFFSAWAPELADDPRMLREMAQFERLAASPARARALVDLWGHNDATADLERVRVPTLVMHDRADVLLPTAHAEFMAAHIEGAEYHEYPGPTEASPAEIAQVMTEMTCEFLTGSRALAQSERIVGALLFVDIVDSTGRVALTGDRAWRNEVEAFRRAVEEVLERSGAARLVNTRGDDVFLLCRTVGSSLDVAHALRARALELGLETRAGIHLAEVDDLGDDVLGLGVHVAARVCEVASPDQILVTESARAAVLGGPEQFADAGTHELKGIPGDWRLASVVDRSEQ